ncbi:uncharacterized protein BDR25DRAFT_363642 [Lindgomyces ingoldianus]|uniref:Uncharacterized protein n=1 Tax=Lindgomyces ingoldianus TaxID=673940 RepID=A0ACB6Q7E0_9PLEO|nr:uncharacterized protein BDR25DRAFT_363642 [Lindgomyces ingoldianus]KAF2462720.1 hypothetical protein BDR25DRAFT_363642 [Lindgomyces ingoldianus]
MKLRAPAKALSIRDTPPRALPWLVGAALGVHPVFVLVVLSSAGHVLAVIAATEPAPTTPRRSAPATPRRSAPTTRMPAPTTPRRPPPGALRAHGECHDSASSIEKKKREEKEEGEEEKEEEGEGEEEQGDVSPGLLARH